MNHSLITVDNHLLGSKVRCVSLFEQERRVEKKANKTAFKEEKVRQEKQMLNLRSNVQGLKLS